LTIDVCSNEFGYCGSDDVVAWTVVSGKVGELANLELKKQVDQL